MLSPLSDEHSRALVRALLPQGQEVVPAVAERSGGNPLFAEEMARPDRRGGHHRGGGAS
jgi:predicted ATPase